MTEHDPTVGSPDRALADALAYRILRDAPGCVTAGDGSLETGVLAELVDALAPVLREAAVAAAREGQATWYSEKDCLAVFVAALRGDANADR